METNELLISRHNRHCLQFRSLATNSDIHATNYSSIYNLTKRMIERDYPECTTTIRPPKSFLLWIYKRLTIARHDTR